MTIKEARKAAGLTQQGMSDLLGIPKRTLENWDSGKRTPPEWAERLIVEKLNRIAEERRMKPLYKVEMETETWDGEQNSGQVYYTDTGYDISTDKWDMLDWFEELDLSDRDEDGIRKDAEIYNGIDAEITYKRTVYKFVPDEDYDPETDNEDSWEIVSEDEIGYSSILKAYLS